MPVVIEGIDLVALCACVVVIALLYLALGLARAIAGALDVDIFGHHPFGGIANALRNSIISWLNSAIEVVQHAITDLFDGLVWSLGLMLKGITDLGDDLEWAFTHAWNVTLHNTFRDLYDWAHSHFEATTAHFGRLEKTVADNFTAAKHFATTQANHAEAMAGKYADSLRAKILDALVPRIKNLEHFANVTVPADISHIQHTIASVLGELHREEERLGGFIEELPADILKELDKLSKHVGYAGFAALAAAVPLLARELATFERETGLEELTCRTNVKGICGVNPSLWANLLGGLVISEFALHLGTMLPIAREAMREFEGLIKEAK